MRLPIPSDPVILSGMTDTPHTGTCHCGRVTLIIPRAPDFINECNCSLCHKLGTIWGYFDPAAMTVSGDTQSYTRDDCHPPALRTHFCGHCSCVTHWSAASALAEGRMGVNMRLFGDAAVAGIEVRRVDGRSW